MSTQWRRRLVVAGGAAVIVAIVVVTAWAVSVPPEPEELTVEALPAPGGRSDIVVSVVDSDRAQTAAGGRSTVALECLRVDGGVEIRSLHAFPFTDTDGGALAPHVHQTVSRNQLERIERCRLGGTRPLLEGALRPAGVR